MAGSNGDAAKRREAAGLGKLLPELLANIHDRLKFVDRIAFATVFAALCDDSTVFSPPATWLLLPYDKKDPTTATLFSVADRRAATVRAPGPALRDHLVLGSSRGWLATADYQGQIHLVNPATGEQHALPDITTMGVFFPRRHSHGYFSVRIKRFMTTRFGGGPPFRDNCWGPDGEGTITFPADQMRTRFYRKVVLSIGRCPGSHAAMLILYQTFGAPAFARADDGAAAWKLAPSPDGVEDAIHHAGRFHSITYSGLVEAWDHNAESGAYTSTAVAPRLPTTIGIEEDEGRSPHKYLVVTPGGRLMVVIKHVRVTKDERYHGVDRWTCSFKVHVLGDDGNWKETRDIGDTALFVGVNNSLCVPTIGHRLEVEAGCVYFTDDELWEAELRKRNKKNLYNDDDDDETDDELGDAELHKRNKENSYIDVRPVGVYSLKDGMVKRIDGLGRELYRSFASAPPVWITPSIP